MTVRTLIAIGTFLIAPTTVSKAQDAPDMKEPLGYPGFNGKVALNVRGAESAWTPFTPKAVPDGAPNTLLVHYGDTGLGAWSRYGGKTNMPTPDDLAAESLT